MQSAVDRRLSHSIGTRLLAFVIVVVVGIIALVAITTYYYSRIVLAHEAERNYEEQGYLLQTLRNDVTESVLLVDRLLFENDASVVPQLLAVNEDTLAKFAVYQSRAEAAGLMNDVYLATEHEPIVYNLRNEFFRVVSLYRSQQTEEAIRARKGILDKHLVSLKSFIEASQELRRFDILDQKDRADALERQAQYVIIASFFIITAAILLVAFFIRRSIVRPLASLADSMQRFSLDDDNSGVQYLADDEIGDLGRAFDDMQKKLTHQQAQAQKLLEAKLVAEQENIAKTAFLANMSHEIRTPMNGVVGMSEILALSNLQPDQLRMVNTIHESSRSLLRIIDDILDLSKISAEKLSLEMAPMRLRDSAETVFKTLGPIAKKNHVRLSLIVDARIPDYLNTDDVRLRQVLMNLLSNAVKFSRREAQESPGRVDLQIEYLSDTQMTISVADNGIGISEEDIDALFEPFTQAKSIPAQQFGGTGLGLTITRNLVGMMGGTIDVDSKLDEGSIFSITLPYVAADGENDDPDISGLNLVALVDDDVHRGMITQCLEQNGAGIVFVETEIELFSRLSASEGSLYVLLGLNSMAENDRVRREASPGADHIKFLSLIVGASEGSAGFSSGYYTIEKWVLLPSSLIRGLAWLAGRERQEMQSVAERGRGVVRAIAKDKKHRILLVEDNLVNQLVISAQLDILGYSVDVSDNGLDGLEKWKSGNFDLILSDCQMPKMDGFEMTAELRKLERENASTAIPVIAITANALKGEEEHCLASGMNAYLAKPVALERLQSVLQSWLP